MRWPLRNQIMLPMVGVILASLVAVSVLNAFLSVRRTHLRIERELNEVATTLADATFPLTDGVLVVPANGAPTVRRIEGWDANGDRWERLIAKNLELDAPYR